jgi:membrane protein DedA with SNARE-associated domain
MVFLAGAFTQIGCAEWEWERSDSTSRFKPSARSMRFGLAMRALYHPNFRRVKEMVCRDPRPPAPTICRPVARHNRRQITPRAVSSPADGGLAQPNSIGLLKLCLPERTTRLVRSSVLRDRMVAGAASAEVTGGKELPWRNRLWFLVARMITELISHTAVKVLDATGYVGAGFLMMLESMIAPVPSEAVMPFVGFQVADGKWNLWCAILATSIGTIVGSLLSYWMGYYGGKPFVLKVGRYLFLNQRDLERTEAFFHKRQGVWTIFISRFIPVVRHFISIPAGIGRMPLLPFLVVTFVGGTMWNSFLLVCGMKLREQWTLVQKYSHQIDYAVVVALILGAVWFLMKRRKEARGQEDRYTS